MTRYARGSEWRKWDLHVHVPGTKLNNGYGEPSQKVWDDFCRTLEESDVAVFGITDYYSCDSYFEFRREHTERYSTSDKVFLPNIEMRLNESVNKDRQHVNVHLLFRPDVPDASIRKFLAGLQTESTDQNGRPLKASELSTTDQFRSTTVSRSKLEAAITAEFGKQPRQDNMLILVPTGNDGLWTDGGKHRDHRLAYEIDKFADALFGSAKSAPHYVKEDRYEKPGMPARSKPVFAGCDAHDLGALAARLGRSEGVV